MDLLKQDLRFVRALDTATLTRAAAVELMLPAGTNTSMVCKGVKSIFALRNASRVEILATFGDSSTAAMRTSVGEGAAYYLGFLPGLSYFEPAIPLRPVDRGSTDDNFNHFL
jgi:hypothetical protein